MFPLDVPTMRKPHVPYGKRPIRPSNSTQQREASGSNENETKGEQAYERISQQARRRDYRAKAQRRVDTISSRGKTAARDKAAMHDSPSCNSLKGTGVLHRNRLDSDTNGEEDIAEAVARSLVDNEGAAPEAADIAKAIVMSLSTHDKPSSPSRAASPYDALKVLKEVMEACMKCLDESTQGQDMVSASQIAGCIKSWRGTISNVIYAAKTAEDRRIGDLKVQLCFDQKVREKHQQETEKLNQMWEAKVLEMQCEQQKKKAETYEAQIAEQRSASLSEVTLEEQHPIVKQRRPQAIKSASPYVHDEVSRLSRDIAVLRSEHAAELESRRHESSLLKQKAERLADANAALRQTQKTKKNEQKQKMEKLIQTYEARVKILQGTPKPVDTNTVSRPTQGRVTPSELLLSKIEESQDKAQTDCQITRSDPTGRLGSSVSPRKRKLDGDMFSQAESVDQPRKRVRARSME